MSWDWFKQKNRFARGGIYTDLVTSHYRFVTKSEFDFLLETNANKIIGQLKSLGEELTDNSNDNPHASASDVDLQRAPTKGAVDSFILNVDSCLTDG